MSGVLITFEGIDGSGKSTQAGLLRDLLMKRGAPVTLLREPGDTALGERIRELLLGHEHHDMTAESELFLYLAARAQLTRQVICPILDRTETLILDRFIDSTVAYQGCARGLGYDRVRAMNLTATGGLMPSLTLFIDIDPMEGLSRAGDQPDRLEAEGVSFMANVREGYLKIARDEPERFVRIDGAGTIESVHDAVVRAVTEKLPRILSADA